MTPLSCKEANAMCDKAWNANFKKDMALAHYNLCAAKVGKMPPATANIPQCQTEAEAFKSAWNEWIPAVKVCNSNIDCPGWTPNTTATLGEIV